MINFFKKIINNYFLFIEKKSVKRVIEIILLIWVSFVFALYCYYHEYYYLLCSISFIGFLIVLFLNIFYSPKQKINKKVFQKIVRYFIKKDEINIKLKNLLFSIPIIAVILTNFSLLLIIINNHFFNNQNFSNFNFISAVSNFLFYQSNIIQKIFSVYLFYILMVLLVYAIGRKTLKIFKFNFDNKIELFLFSVGIGFIPFMFGTFFIALLGLLYSWAIWTIIVLLFIYSFSELKKIFKEINIINFKLLFRNFFESFKSLIFVGLFILLIFNFISAFKPAPTDTDSLHTYFNAPNLYVYYHQYKPLMHFAGSNMAQNTEMIYATVLSILDASYIVHFSWLFFILCLIGFYFLMKRIFGEKHATLGLICLYFIPWNFYYIYTNKVEFALAFYSMLMLYSLWLWYKNNLANRYLYFLGILSGIAMGIKYNTALLIVLLYLVAFFLLIVRYKKNILLKFKIKSVIISGLLAIIFFAPWAIKNQIYFNDIFFPLNYFSKNKINFDDLVIDHKYEKKRKQEISYLKYATEYNKSPMINFLNTFWNQSIGKNKLKNLRNNFGFPLLLIFPFYFVYLKNKKIMIILSILIIYFLIWYLVAGDRLWYIFFGFMLLYILLPCLFLKNKQFFLIYILFIIITLATSITITRNICYLINDDEENYLMNVVPSYNIEKYINNLKLASNEKILSIKNPMAAFIKYNDQLLYIDSHFAKSSYMLHKGNNKFYNFLQNYSIKYIVYPFEKNNACELWLKNKNYSLNKYLQEYHHKIPSICSDTKILNSFFKNYTEIIFCDKSYVLYKLKK